MRIIFYYLFYRPLSELLAPRFFPKHALSFENGPSAYLIYRAANVRGGSLLTLSLFGPTCPLLSVWLKLAPANDVGGRFFYF